jgi:hypothetical protein
MGRKLQFLPIQQDLDSRRQNNLSKHVRVLLESLAGLQHLYHTADKTGRRGTICFVKNHHTSLPISHTMHL